MFRFAPICLVAVTLSATILAAQESSGDATAPDAASSRSSPENAPPAVLVYPRPATKTCAIPLLPVSPKGFDPMPPMRPDRRGHIRIVDPPAPACEDWGPVTSPPRGPIQIRPFRRPR